MQPTTITSSAAPQENTDNQDKFVWGGTGPGAIWFTCTIA